ncbi:nitroreductase family protein [Emcibacter sp.]|uniref:nitroreductase family protein n=1 Tax=Emcibacter sp. TaxID=1979954 RepID=UPI002AA7A073|nr:nitroreductase family protein [Emcibacter sp.]
MASFLNFIKSSLSEDSKRKIWSWLELFDRKVAFLVHRSRFLSRVRYCLKPGGFGDEFYALQNGIVKYYTGLKLVKHTHALLRRNTHRLEKGLVMRPRRDVFAVDFINETVDLYRALLTSLDEPNEEIFWAHDVLNEYFSVVNIEDNVSVQAAYEKFRQHPVDKKDAIKRAPFLRKKGPTITYEQFLDLCRYRRSVRWFLQKPVPRTLLDQAFAAAALSPTACNRQSYSFRVLDDPELIAKASVIPGGAGGFNHNMPVYIVVTGKLRSYVKSYDRHAIYIDSSLAVMAFVFCLETLGLASCIINWGDHPKKNKRMSKLLNLEDDERVITTIAVGYPDPTGLVPFSTKKEIEYLRSYNK